ncbi:DUF3429 domain-containing protein [Jannaschia sp. S6380]|uniref:DUF3429 domain-containing protein n=1 Tax=Jannaschia sp. S6380 TaxID=2926408 RepID=UPI001FF1464C|nr:DUF3429 domain-containing protein [Jannaschia sp. S6380]MCK0169374.1 DUF3429 domain-containing protein [Jannaschia sp. S6380]
MFNARIPTSALVLGLAGVIPFAWGLVTIWSEPAARMTVSLAGSRFTGPYVGLFYGAVILAFMSGVLWGFATRAEGRIAATGYALSVLPALWAFFMTGGGPEAAAISLMAGFAGLLCLDWLFWKYGLAPEWWMKLRLILTACVLLCLLPVAL